VKAPGPGPLQFLRGVRARGFLDFVGQQWREHGDVFQVRLGRRTLMFAMRPEAVEHVSVTRRKNYEKLASYDVVRQFLTGDGLVASTGETWRRQRRLLAPLFTPKGVQAFAELMLGEAQRLQERWEGLAGPGAEVEIAEEMTSVTASIILRAMFSSETTASINQMRQAVETMIAFVHARSTGVGLPLWLPTETNRRFKEARALVQELISGLIEQRRAMDESRWPDDLLSRLMRARDEETGQPMSDSLLRDESITAFFAGHETTARTMTFAWYALAANPHVAAKLHEELDRVLGGRPPTVEALRQLPYASQVVKEVLRMYPPAPFYARDAVEADQLAGFDVPAGASVMLSPYYTHRHPEFWANPDRFDPERWTKEREAALHDYQYHPFAAGARICIGNNFSLLESQALLAVLAQRFTPKLRHDYQARWEMQGVLGLANGLPMTIAVRA
jgi:cytochrome P450